MSAVLEIAIALVVGMGNDQAPVEEERPSPGGADEFQRLVREEVVRVEQAVGGVTRAIAADRVMSMGNDTRSSLRHRKSGSGYGRVAG
jgi:hypothetical protein